MTLSPRSLQGKLLGFAALLVLAPGIVQGVLADRSARESLGRVIGAQLAREAGHTAERVASALRGERETLVSFARQDLMREVRVDDIDKRISQALRTLREGSAARLEYVVLRPDAVVVAASEPARLGRTAPAWASRLSPARDPEGVSLSAAESGLVLATAVPDPDEGPAALGVLAGLVGWRLLTDVTSSVGRDLSAADGEVSVVVARPDGELLGRSETLDRFVPAPADWSLGAAGDAPDYAVDEEAGVIAGRAALAPELPGWDLFVVEPLERALLPARRLTRRLALLTTAALALALGVAAAGSRRVVRPLRELTQAIREVGRGGARNLSVEVRSADEVGTLAAAFNRMLADLDRVQRDLVEAEKFAFVGELASRVAHEVRTSLGVLRSSAQLLERSLPPGQEEAMGELVQMMRAEVGRLGRIVDDLLTLGRPRPLQLEPTPLLEPVRRALDFVAPRAEEKGLRLRRSLPAEGPVVRCDPEAITQVVVNLLVNALEEARREVCIEVSEAGTRRGCLRVWDDGPGVPSELRDRIFDPFVTGRENGVGLGLSFVKRVIHEHEGEVRLEEDPGGGACFQVELPLAETGA